MYEAAKMEVIRAGKASASLLQRRLRVGYARAPDCWIFWKITALLASGRAKPRDVFAAKDTLAGRRHRRRSIMTVPSKIRQSGISGRCKNYEPR